jgi:hypothetical protein
VIINVISFRDVGFMYKIYKKGALDSQVIKFTSCLLPWSVVLWLLPPLKLYHIAESDVNHLNSIILYKIYDTIYLFTSIIVGCPTKDFCEFALTELHTPVWNIVGMRRTSRIEIKMSSLYIVVTFFFKLGSKVKI